MAKSGLTHIDVGPELTRTEWESEESHALINGTSFPGSPVERQLFYRNDLHEWYIYTGSAWVSLQAAGSGLVVHDNTYHDPDYEEEGVAATQIETHRTTAVHAADQPPDLHDNAKHSPDFEEEGVAATQIETHRTAAEHTQDQPSNFLKLSDTPAAFTGQAGKYPKVNVGESALEFDTPGGAGDMLKSVYDTDDDGVVDDSEKLEGSTKVEVQTHNPAEHGNEAHDPDFASAAALSTHQATVNAHAAAVAATANRIALRDASARAKFAAPAAAGDALIKGTAITDVEHGSRGSALHADSHGQNTDKLIKDADGDTQIQVEEAADEDTVRMDVAGVEAFRLSSIGMLTLAKQSKARAYRDGDWWLATGAWIRVPLNAENYDNQNEFDTTSKIGTADATEANKLHDADGGFSAADVGRWVYNTTDHTYTTVTAYVDSGELTLAADIMADTEGYELYAGIFTATEAGYYQVNAVIRCNWTLADKWYFAGLSKNGATASSGGWQSSVGDGIATNCISGAFGDVIYLAANDYIELQIYHNEGDAGKFRGSGDQTYLAVHKLS